tara:strand:+ start:744 stop:908 length:165 start_codon:yes stop_codon:yes gene_type:complete
MLLHEKVEGLPSTLLSYYAALRIADQVAVAAVKQFPVRQLGHVNLDAVLDKHTE